MFSVCLVYAQGKAFDGGLPFDHSIVELTHLWQKKSDSFDAGDISRAEYDEWHYLMVVGKGGFSRFIVRSML